MESTSLLSGIKSKIIERDVFSHLNDKIKYKIVAYSKKFQGLLNMSLQDYKDKCFESFSHIDVLSCLSTKNEPELPIKTNKYPHYLEKRYSNEIEKNKIKMETFKKIINEFLESYFTKIYNDYKSKEEINKSFLDNQLIIDIYSPFYKLLLKKDIFEKLFILRIPFPIIYSNGLMQDYYDATDLLNEVNPNFSSFYYEIESLSDENILYDFIDFCKYFKKVKKLILEIRTHSFKFPTEIFSFSNIKENLVYLEIKFHGILPYNFEKNMKNLDVLEELRLDGVEYFYLKNSNLKYLYISNSNHIKFAKNCFTKIQIINIFRVQRIEVENDNTFLLDTEKIKLPELIIFQVSFCGREFNDIFDFSSCPKLKYFIRLSIYDFLSLGENCLEKVYIGSNYSSSLDSEVNMLEKLMTIKTLKEIKMFISYIKEENIKSIKGENTSVEKLIIVLDKRNNLAFNEINLYSLQSKFKNLKEFQLYISNSFYSNNKSGCKLDIKQESNCQINNFKFSQGNDNDYIVKLYLAPYENLVNIEFGCMLTSFKYEESFPLFQGKCSNIFKSLKSFKFVSSKIYPEEFDSRIITNIINNLDKMPNLEIFIFKAPFNIDKTLYKKFIEKLLVSKVKIIELDLNYLYHLSNCYSNEELKLLFKGINIEKFEKVLIEK